MSFKLKQGNNPPFKLLGSDYPHSNSTVFETRNALRSPIMQSTENVNNLTNLISKDKDDKDEGYNLLNELDTDYVGNDLLATTKQYYDAGAHLGGGNLDYEGWLSTIKKLGYKKKKKPGLDLEGVLNRASEYGVDPKDMIQNKDGNWVPKEGAKNIEYGDTWDSETGGWRDDATTEGIPTDDNAGTDNDTGTDNDAGTGGGASASTNDNTGTDDAGNENEGVNNLSSSYNFSEMSRSDIVKSLKSLKRGSQERKDAYKALNWAPDHTLD